MNNFKNIQEALIIDSLDEIYDTILLKIYSATAGQVLKLYKCISNIFTLMKVNWRCTMSCCLNSSVGRKRPQNQTKQHSNIIQGCSPVLYYICREYSARQK